MSEYLTTREALSLSPKDVEFVAQERMKYGSDMFDENDVVPLQNKDKLALVAVGSVKIRMTEKAQLKAKEKAAKKAAKKSSQKAVKPYKDKSMDGKGKAK